MYGRARRLQLLKVIGIILGALLLIFIAYKIIFATSEVETKRENNFSYMKSYLKGLGYTCNAIEYSGRFCSLKEGDNSYTFYRYDDGFRYYVVTGSYSVYIIHSADGDSISFTGLSDALAKYRNKEYSCTLKDSNNIFSGVDKCTYDGEELDSESYLEYINYYLSEMESLVDASGYDKDTLINEYKWEEKNSF